MNKNKTLLALLVVCFIGIAFGVYGLWGSKTNQSLGGGKIQVGQQFTDAAATTTVGAWLTTTDTASSTFGPFSSSNSQSFTYQLCATASSSSSQLDYNLLFSNDTQDNKTWFWETSATQDSNSSITHEIVTHHLSLATTTVGVNYKCTDILTSPMDARFVKIKMGVSGANAWVWRSATPLFGF